MACGPHPITSGGFMWPTRQFAIYHIFPFNSCIWDHMSHVIWLFPQLHCQPIMQGHLCGVAQGSALFIVLMFILQYYVFALTVYVCCLSSFVLFFYIDAAVLLFIQDKWDNKVHLLLSSFPQMLLKINIWVPCLENMDDWLRIQPSTVPINRKYTMYLNCSILIWF